MAKFVLIYTGGGGTAATEEEQQRIMGEWGVWYGKLGDAVVDGGMPFGQSHHITDAGADGAGAVSAPAPTGYTVIEADSLEAAVAASKDHPHLQHGGQVSVFQGIEMG
jgi:hypothetical protein